MFNLATNFCFYLDTDNKKSSELFLLLYNIERYLNGAIIEMGRLDKSRKNINKELRHLRDGVVRVKHKNKNNNKLICLSLDTHFYFLCLDKIDKNLRRLAHELHDKNIIKLCQKLKKIIDINAVRNDLEHIDSRALGYKNIKDEKLGIKKHIMDFGNFIGDEFSFDGKRYTSSKKSLGEIKQIFRELIAILHRDYAIKNPIYIRQMRQMGQKIVTDSINKKIKKLRKARLI